MKVRKHFKLTEATVTQVGCMFIRNILSEMMSQVKTDEEKKKLYKDYKSKLAHFFDEITMNKNADEDSKAFSQFSKNVISQVDHKGEFELKFLQLLEHLKTNPSHDEIVCYKHWCLNKADCELFDETIKLALETWLNSKGGQYVASEIEEGMKTVPKIRHYLKKNPEKSYEDALAFYGIPNAFAVKAIAKKESRSKNSRRLVENPVIDHPSLRNVYDYGKAKHDATGAIRKNSGAPYWVHPEMVADVVEAYGGTEDEIAAALLHDTLEDTTATAEELEENFGPNVAQIVEEVTNFRPELERIGKENYINQELLELSPSALLVKAADCYCNSIDSPKPGQAERIARNFTYMLNNRDDIPDNVRRLIKSLPLMQNYDLDKSEFENSFDDEGFEEKEYMKLVSSRKRTVNKKALKETLEETKYVPIPLNDNSYQDDLIAVQLPVESAYAGNWLAWSASSQGDSRVAAVVLSNSDVDKVFTVDPFLSTERLQEKGFEVVKKLPNVLCDLSMDKFEITFELAPGESYIYCYDYDTTETISGLYFGDDALSYLWDLEQDQYNQD